MRPDPKIKFNNVDSAFVRNSNVSVCRTSIGSTNSILESYSLGVSESSDTKWKEAPLSTMYCRVNQYNIRLPARVANLMGLKSLGAEIFACEGEGSPLANKRVEPLEEKKASLLNGPSE